MIQAFKIDQATGEFIEPVLLKDVSELQDDMVQTKPIDGLFKPKFDGANWVEGMDQSEIDTIKNTPIPKSKMEVLEDTVMSLMDTIMQIQLGGI